MKSVTLKDVARAANVSYATVSRALSGSTQIGSATRERILKLCDEMGYATNYIARSMVTNRTETIGLVVPNIRNQFMAEIAYYAEKSARQNGYNTILCNSLPDISQEQTVVRLLVSRKVDGILIIPQSADSYEGLKCFTDQIPTVFISENLRDLPQSYVTVDNPRGSRMAVEYLYNLGHRRIIYFGERNSITHHMRADGYRKACQELGIEPRVITSDYSRSSIKKGYSIALELFSHPIDYTAICASTDSNALGIMKAADELGIRIPEQLSLVGFDNIQSAELPRIELTTISQPKKEMGIQAVDMLLDKIKNGTEGYTYRILLPKLIERSSCRSISETEQA